MESIDNSAFRQVTVDRFQGEIHPDRRGRGQRQHRNPGLLEHLGKRLTVDQMTVLVDSGVSKNQVSMRPLKHCRELRFAVVVQNLLGSAVHAGIREHAVAIDVHDVIRFAHRLCFQQYAAELAESRRTQDAEPHLLPCLRVEKFEQLSRRKAEGITRAAGRAR